MHYKTIIMLMLVITLVVVPPCLLIVISIKDLMIKRHWFIILILMLLATICSRIIAAETDNFIAGFISGLGIWLIGFLPIIYIDSLKKKNHIGYKGVRKRIADWLDQPIKTLF